MTTHSFFNPLSLFDDQDFFFSPFERPSNALRLKSEEEPERNLSLRSFRRDPFSSDFFGGDMVPFEDMISKISPFRSSSNSIHEMFENFRKNMEEEIKAFEELEKNPPSLEDPEHTSCFMRVMTNDNGYVKVKTMKKTPDSEWETRVEEFERGNPSLENKESEEKMQLEDKDQVEITEEGSSSQ